MMICFVTTSKGRLDYVKQTLPFMLKQAPVRLVDYECPQETGRWAAEHHPQTERIYATGAAVFNISRARNIGAAGAEYEWLAFIDSDCVPQPGLVDAMCKQATANCYFEFLDKVEGHAGFTCCRKADWQEVEGYDESVRGYGYDDTQFKLKLQALGRKPVFLDKSLLTHIPHPAKLQTQFYQNKNTDTSYPENVQRLTANLAAWKKRKGLS